jgi:DNA-binding transcriptional LysR family regulator
MELYLLQSFVTVANEGGITKASKRLNLTPPAVSGHIKALEDELSIDLFLRTSKGMELTPKGLRIKEKAENVLAATQELRNQALRMQSSLLGELKIGLNASAGLLKVAEITVELRKTNPDIDILFEISTSGRIIDELLSCKLDAGYVFGPISSPLINSIPLQNIELQIAIPSAFLTRYRCQSWQDLAQLPWICSDGYCPFQKITNDLFAEKALTLSRTITTNDETTKLDLVKQGSGVALLSADECKNNVANGEIVTWDNTKPIQCELSFAFLHKRKSDPVIAAMLDTILTVWKKDDIQQEEKS